MSFPPDLEHAIRIAHVPASVRLLVRRVRGLSVRASVGTDFASLPTLPALLKLASLEPESVTVTSRDGGVATSITIAHGGAHWDVPSDALREPLGMLVEAVLAALLPKGALVVAAHEASRDLARIDALRIALGIMLDQSAAGRDNPIDHALATFLGAVTAGSGLGFHRAALFVFDPVQAGFVGRMAVGPLDIEEARRTWESLELDAIAFERQLALSSTHGAFADRVRSLVLPRQAEVTATIERGALLFDRPGGPELESLRVLDPASSFVLAPLRVGEQTRAVVFADRRFAPEPITPDLAASLAAFAAQTALAWETIRLLREVDELARTDGLTGLMNRREFEARFAQERYRLQRKVAPLSLLVVDLDEFREVNQRRGHEGGDVVLRMVGRVLHDSLRVDDIAARFGGDEFVVVLPGAGPLEAASVARRVGVAARQQAISLSIGVASYPEDADHPDNLFGVADRHLFAAKEAGRGCACLGPGTAPIVFADEHDPQ